MRIFIDTSAFLSYLNAQDTHNAPAVETLAVLLKEDAELVCTNYILLETLSLLQRRFGMAAVQDFQQRFTPRLHVVWISAEQHDMAVNYLLQSNRRQLSLVDCSSFDTMRRLGIEKVFTFDEHFQEQGFQTIPQR